MFGGVSQPKADPPGGLIFKFGTISSLQQDIRYIFIFSYDKKWALTMTLLTT